MKIKPKIKPKLKVKNIDEEIKKIYIDHHERKQSRKRRMRDLFLYLILLTVIFGCTKPIPEVVYLTKYDTIYVSQLDTTYINHLDTTYIHTTDTIYIVLTDTIYISVIGIDTIIITPPVITPDSDIVFDVEGHPYSIINIGTQSWLASNLYTSKYNTGEDIPTTTLSTREMIEPKYQFTHDSTIDISRDGRFYTWYTIMDPRGICPVGWHVPSRTDWQTLGIYLADNGYGNSISPNNIGKSLASSVGWRYSYIPTTIGYEQEKNNSSGFNALPVGNVTDQYYGLDDHSSYSTRAIYWTSTPANDNLDIMAYNVHMKSEESWVVLEINRKSWSNSVRCIKNQ